MASNVTRGGLKKAKMINLTTNEEVECMFNPHEYTLTKSNQWQQSESMGRNTPRATFMSGGSQILRLNLEFDTLAAGTDVRTYTDKLWTMMKIHEEDTNDESGKGTPPEVAFEWGRLYFKAVITTMTQKFTLFTPDGTPVRCTVNVTLEQKEDIDDYKDGESVTNAVRDAGKTILAKDGDRVDNMLADADNDMNKLRDVMESNNIDNPLNIPTGNALSLAKKKIQELKR